MDLIVQSIAVNIQHAKVKATVHHMEHVNVIVVIMDTTVQSTAKAIQHAKVMATVHHLEHVNVKVAILDTTVQVKSAMDIPTTVAVVQNISHVVSTKVIVILTLTVL